jgi:pseudaminic acid synthase
VALGAKIIEKHLILDRALGGVDSSFSLNVDEFREMVEAVRKTELALGRPSLEPSPRQLKGRRNARSLFVVQTIEAGEAITRANVRSVRPDMGLHPRYFEEVLGKKALRRLEKGTPLQLADLS